MIFAMARPQATVTVVGDLKLQQALEAHIGDWAVAFNMMTALKDPAAKLASKGLATFQALGDANDVSLLKQAVTKWNYYATAALAGLPNGAGIPALIQLAQDPAISSPKCRRP